MHKIHIPADALISYRMSDLPLHEGAQMVYDIAKSYSGPVIEVIQKNSSAGFIFKLNDIFLASEDIG